MNPTLAPEEEAFRQEVVDVPRRPRARSTGSSSTRASTTPPCGRLYRALGERGWLSLAWPVEVGGRGLPPVYEFILWDEMAYARAARPPLGSGIVAKTIIAYGTDEQTRALPPRAARRHDVLLARLLRARGRLRSRRRAHACRARRATSTCSTARSAGRRAATAPTTCGCCAAPARPRATAAGSRC